MGELEKEALDKLDKLIEEALDQRSEFFTKEEAMLLKKVAARERGWVAIGALAGTAKTVLTYFGFFLATWAAFKAGLISWIAESLGRQ